MQVDRRFLKQLLWVGIVTAIMLPVGGMVFPYVDGPLNDMQFQTIEAVLSTSLGFGLYALFG